MTDKPPPALISVAEASEVLGIPRSTAYMLARTTGELVPGVPVGRIGSRLRVSRAQLAHFIELGFERQAPA